MLISVFNYLISLLSSVINWLFTLVINDEPKITLGIFLLACAFIGIVIYFILGTDFFPGHISMSSLRYKTNNKKEPTVVYHVHTNINSKKGGS